MKKTDIFALTALRGVAALFIVVHHVGLLMLPFKSTDYAPLFGQLAQLGMSVFFVLSGFVIYYNYGNVVCYKSGIIKFILARIARLAPLYIFLYF